LLPVRYWDFLMKYIGNIHTLSTNIKFISTSFRNRKKARLWRAFLPVSQRFQLNVIFTDNVRILCLSCVQCQKVQKQLLIYLKISETRVILIGYHGVIYHDRTYTGTVSFHCSTWIRYQKNYILVSDRIQQKWSSQCNMTA